MRIALIVALIFFSTNALAQAVCGERSAILKQLDGKYKESPISIGLSANGSVVEVTRGPPPKHTWTILLTNPGGVTCLMAGGEHWEHVKKKKAGFKPL